MSLEQKDLSEMLETAVVAARLAGQHAMEQMSYVKAVKKSESELVTQADAQCQRIIIQRIRETYPGSRLHRRGRREGQDVQTAAPRRAGHLVGDRSDRRDEQLRPRNPGLHRQRRRVVRGRAGGRRGFPAGHRFHVHGGQGRRGPVGRPAHLCRRGGDRPSDERRLGQPLRRYAAALGRAISSASRGSAISARPPCIWPTSAEEGWWPP